MMLIVALVFTIQADYLHIVSRIMILEFCSACGMLYTMNEVYFERPAIRSQEVMQRKL